MTGQLLLHNWLQADTPPNLRQVFSDILTKKINGLSQIDNVDWIREQNVPKLD
jgi:hypothetical protein